MAGQTVSNPGAVAARANVGGGGNASNALYLNSFRISAAADRLAMHVGPQPKNDAVEFCQLCLSLARYARSILCAKTTTLLRILILCMN